MSKFKKFMLLLAAALFVLPATGMAQGKGSGKPTGTTTVPVGGNNSFDGLVQKYQALAGSADNVQSLVSGLRDGTEVVLTREVQAPPPPPPAPQMCTQTVMVPCQVPQFLPGTNIPTGFMVDSTCPSTQTYDCTPPAAPPAPPTIERITFTPPTGNMGFGNVDIALAFAQAQLIEAGIKTPAPADVKAALMGGQVTGQNNSLNLPGILTLRASGLGWGQIANQLGYKLQ